MILRFRVEEKREFQYCGIKVELSLARVTEKWIPEYEDEGGKQPGFMSYEVNKQAGTMSFILPKEEADNYEVWETYPFTVGEKVALDDDLVPAIPGDLRL